MSTSNHFDNERLLIEQCVQQDRAAQKALYDKFAPKMYALCLRYATDQDEAKDFLQEGFIKIYKNIHSFRNEGSFEGWIRRIFVTTCTGFIQKKKHFSEIKESHENLPENVNGFSGLEKLSLKELQHTIQELSAGYRTVFNLYAVEGYSHKEIADLLNISVGTSKSQYARAKQTLQKNLETKMLIKNNN